MLLFAFLDLPWDDPEERPWEYGKQKSGKWRLLTLL